jgi:diguanylate cyclase (GGDEF)-like protein
VEKKRYQQNISLIVSLSCGGIILLLLWSLWTEYHASLSRTRSNTGFTAELMGSNIRRSLDDLSELLHGIKNAGRLLDDKATLGQPKDAFQAISSWILERKPQIRTLTVISPSGEIRFWNREEPPPNLADRDYVQYHQENSESDLFVSAPLRSKLNDEWILVASLAARDAAGTLKAIITASIAPEFFGPQFQEISHTKGLGLAVVTRAGNPVWSDQTVASSIALLEEGAEIDWQNLPKRGSLDLWSPDETVLNIVGYYRLDQYPFVCLAITSMGDTLREWKKEALISAFAILLLLLLSIAVTRRLILNYTQLIEKRDELALMAMTDPLTGLSNRRHLWEQAKLLISSAQRYRFPLAVIVLDIDHFKKINDTHGHDVGDRVIKKLADAIRASVRETDITSRTGGEEFAIVLSHTDMHHAQAKAEDLRESVKALSFQSDQQAFTITISLGVAALIDDLKKALSSADDALYQAKREGRDQVVCADAAYSSR